MTGMSHDLSVQDSVAKNPMFLKKGIVVIDDDEQFCELIRVVGRNLGIPVESFVSLYELGSFACLRSYDLAIIDYRLESINGIEIAVYVDTFFNQLPVLLVSADPELARTKSKWPNSIKNFVCKSRGPFAILDSACRVLQRDQYLQRFQNPTE